MKAQSDIAVVGLAVMGENLILNMASKGFTVTAYNRSYQKVENFIAGRAKDKSIRGADSIETMVASLASPRKIMLMVKSGQVVDDFITQLLPHLDEGDIVIDGGNSQFEDSNRRTKALAEKGILYVGTGVSGGEEGALLGPSIMPGGNPAAWPHVKPIFQAISAKVKDENGDATIPCCDWVGEDGAGHFVKMVHNGIEYGDMQIICEGYLVMRDLLGMNTDEIQAVFESWKNTELSSYLIDITAEILAFKENGEALVEKILDTAGQKGTGKWTGVTALHLGVPLTLIGEAVFARCLSAQKGQRVAASSILPGPTPTFSSSEKTTFIEHLKQALLAAKIVSYAQGFALIQEAASEYKWKLDYGSIAMMWREGCIIRSVFLDNIKTAYDKNPQLDNLMLDDYFSALLKGAQTGWREVIASAAINGVSMPCISSSLSYYDGYRTEHLPANLLQAQRDYFGAHTYERKDKPKGEFFHTNWTGRGGDTASTTYDL